MEITKKIPFGKKIVRKNDLYNLAMVFDNEAGDCTEKPKLRYDVNCLDNVTFSEENSGIFSNISKIDTHIIDSVLMEMNSYVDDKHISLAVASNEYARNKVVISGKNENWVQGVAGRFNDVLHSIEDQENWFLKHKGIVKFVAAILLGIIPGEFLFTLLLSMIPDNIHVGASTVVISTFSLLGLLRADIWLIPLAKGLVYWVSGWGFSDLLYSWVTKLWKDVEFDTGPEHLKREKKLRNRIYIFLSVILLPLLMSIIFR